jgi:hypothetical protein
VATTTTTDELMVIGSKKKKGWRPVATCPFPQPSFVPTDSTTLAGQ